MHPCENERERSRGNFDAICFVGTVYSLLLYLLIRPVSFERTFFIFTSGVSPVVRSRIKNSYFVDRSRFLARIAGKRGLFKWIFSRYKLQNLPVYGHTHDIYGGIWFLRRATNPISLIEDGTDNYTFPRDKEWWGVSPKVRHIFLTGMLPIPDEIKDKVVIVKMGDLWEERKVEEKELISKIFLGEKPRILDFGGRKVLFLLTQPFSEDSICMEIEKIELYKVVVKRLLKSGMILIIKPHPRDKTDYSEFFPDAQLFPAYVPVELLALIGVDFSNAIIATISSGGIKNSLFVNSEVFQFPELCPENSPKTFRSELERLQKEVKFS